MQYQEKILAEERKSSQALSDIQSKHQAQLEDLKSSLCKIEQEKKELLDSESKLEEELQQCLVS